MTKTKLVPTKYQDQIEDLKERSQEQFYAERKDMAAYCMTAVSLFSEIMQLDNVGQYGLSKALRTKAVFVLAHIRDAAVTITTPLTGRARYGRIDLDRWDAEDLEQRLRDIIAELGKFPVADSIDDQFVRNDLVRILRAVIEGVLKFNQAIKARDDYWN